MVSISKYLLLSGLILLCFFDAALLHADSTFGEKPWTRLETRYTILQYKSDKDLLKFYKDLKYGPGEWNRNPSFSDIPMPEIQKLLSRKVDAIFERAQEILDMRKKFETVTVNIYPNQQQLKRAYSLIYRGECRFRAWYRFRTNTVYINAGDIHAGMLAHELAHGIIDHYFKVKPPSETAEILARYVDSHL